MSKELPRINVVAATSFAGGAELYIARLYRGLVEAGCSVRLIGSIPPWPVDELDSVDLNFGPKWSLRTLPGGVARLWKERRALAREVAGARGEIYHLHFKREQIGFSRLLSRNGQVFWTEHGRFPAGLFGRLILPFYRYAARNVVSIACVSDIVATDIRRLLGSRCEIVVIPNAVDTDKLRPATPAQKAEARERFGLPEGPVAVYAGRIEPAKRAGLAIQAARHGGFSLLVAGQGSQFEELRGAYESESVKFLGQVAGPREIFECADVHLFPSNGAGEGFPTVLLEAAAMGIPSVAADDSGFGSLVVEGGGVAVPASPEGFSGGMSTLIDDPSTRERVRRWSEQYDVRLWVASHIDLFASQAGAAEYLPRSR